ncbi:pilus assembly protein [Alcanivorax sp. S6407]|uniref:TadE/TadG family type IV pilus assembly protein n=1 Tax=Alcanivorax sp. S6407 TaxID=2926424 RepID=UPI001FF116EA|nr:TadE/TadG family type IV pilus assembly protein [Alcanivorax sp. S6407]MCK0153399.1 pilus assembly protein [Alcanivorax sp. S6407]
MVNKTVKKRSQGGAVMVEMALTLPVFLLLVFAIIELALVIFDFTRAVDATRAGARYAIVNDPVTDISTLDCSSVTEVTATCDSAGCTDLMGKMTALYRKLEEENVAVRYGCSSTGFSGNPNPVREVSVSITGQEYELILPALIGFESTITLPPFTSTRVSEDMYTP